MANDKIAEVGVNIAEKATMIWNVADMLRGPFKPHEYGLVILPMTVVKRFHDCLLPTHQAVQAQYEKVKSLAVIDGFLTRASGYQFYNISKFTFDSLLADPDNIEANFRDYLAGFSANVQDVLVKFDFDNIIRRMVESNTPKGYLGPDDKLMRKMVVHGKHKNLSFFAFTATPKDKTLELFGTEHEDDSFHPFHIYSMRQAIEEGFILDVLQNYMTYDTCFKIAKTTPDNPDVPSSRAAKLMGNKKLTNIAKTSDPQIFTESIFPKAFDDAAVESYAESQDTYTTLFEDQGKYHAFMTALAEVVYREMRKQN